MAKSNETQKRPYFQTSGNVRNNRFIKVNFKGTERRKEMGLRKESMVPPVITE